jgi:hypothetical protein
MNPDSKFLLDELKKCFDEQDARLEKRLTEDDEKWERRFQENGDKWERHFADAEVATNSRLSKLEWVVDTLEGERQDMEGSVDNIRLAVKKLNKHYEHISFELPPEAPLLPTTPLLAAGHPSTGLPADRPHGHRSDNHIREGEFGSVTTLIHSPGKGAFTAPFPKADLLDMSAPPDESNSFRVGVVGNLPKLHFPLFEDDNPKLWLSRCENYFEMYSVPTNMWIRVASMHVKGPAGRWWQSVEKKLNSARRISAVSSPTDLVASSMS